MRFPDPQIIEANPVFQLNTILWSMIDAEGGFYTPVLRQAGYFIHSIGRRIQIGSEFRDRLDIRGQPSPDLLAQHRNDPMMLVIECKASSFGPDSSTADQARELLVGGSDLALTIGASNPVPSYVLYVTRATHGENLCPTLSQLRHELSSRGLDTALAGTAVVEIRDDGVWLSLGPGDPVPSPLQRALGQPRRVVELVEGDTPIHLYLIPWDPSVTQDPWLEKFGKALLAARVLTRATTRVARITPPDTLVLRATDLLEEATLGVSALWRTREVNIVESFVAARLAERLEGTGTIRERGKTHAVSMTVRNEEDKGALLSALNDTDEQLFLRGVEQLQFGFDT